MREFEENLKPILKEFGFEEYFLTEKEEDEDVGRTYQMFTKSVPVVLPSGRVSSNKTLEIEYPESECWDLCFSSSEFTIVVPYLKNISVETLQLLEATFLDLNKKLLKIAQEEE